MKTTVNVKKLRKLAAFLDKLKPSHFDFNVVRRECPKTSDNRCGTVGCAIGWTPNVFPKDVKILPKNAYGLQLQMGGAPVSDCSGYNAYDTVAERLFNMPIEDAHKLFTPDEESPVDGDMLSEDATPKEVAKRIRAYVKYAEDNNIGL